MDLQVYSYDVQWEASDVRWASRWDIYLNMDHTKTDKARAAVRSSLLFFGYIFMCATIYIHPNPHTPLTQVHWFSIANSMLIVLFLTGMIAMILIRNLCRDITRYNRVPTEEERAEER